MTELIKLYKELGETPLECIERYRVEHLEYAGVKMSYLGRLDPMAEGLLLVIAGDTRKRAEYLELDKTYEFEVLWGFSTDTYDILGLPVKTDSSLRSLNPLFGGSDTKRKLESVLKKILNKKTQSYPPYSSRPVNGRPMFEWAREGKIEEIDVPTRGIKIFSLEHVHTRIVTGQEILNDIRAKVALVKGDFRQEETLARWSEVLGDKLEEKFYISKLIADVSSGTYIRGLAHEMGEMLGVPALAYSIKRTRVGSFDLE